MRWALTLLALLLLSAPATACALTPTFTDDFKAFSIYTGRGGTWETQYPWGRNYGVTYYSDQTVGTDPFALQAGLTITMTNPGKYTSGVITTRHSFAQTYGYFKAQMTMPQVQGVRPSFSLFPVDGTQGLAVVMETSGSTVFASATPRNYGPSAQVTAPVTPGAHVYAIQWKPKFITFFIDGKSIGRVPNVADQPMYMIAGLGAGEVGSWPGPPHATFPLSMTVRYMHAYQFGCLSG